MIGSRLRSARERAGFTQRQLAQILGFGENEIYRYENEQSKPGSDAITKLARGLGVSSDYLLGITNDEMPRVEITPRQWRVIQAMKKGDKLEAIKVIIEDG